MMGGGGMWWVAVGGDWWWWVASSDGNIPFGRQSMITDTEVLDVVGARVLVGCTDA